MQYNIILLCAKLGFHLYDSPARGLCELHMTWGLLEPLVHTHLGAIVKMLETLIKSQIQ